MRPEDKFFRRLVSYFLYSKQQPDWVLVLRLRSGYIENMALLRLNGRSSFGSVLALCYNLMGSC